MALSRRSKGAPSDLFPGFTDVVEIGAGSLATVYRAREAGTDRLVALKLLNVREASPRAMESFERESLALGEVSSHPHIVTLYRSFRAPDERPVLVLELCTGSIADRLRTGRGMPVAEVVALGVKIGAALETAHRARILHRDVKPQNLLITQFGEPALADFGVAMLQSSTQTTAGLFDFTTLHAAPELLEGGETSAATDVYELASTLYQLIAGRAAFRAYDGESPASVILRILRDPVQPLVHADIPPQLSDLLIRAMSKEKESRPRTAAEFAEQLGAIEIVQGWPRTAFLVRESEADAPAPGPLHRAAPPELLVLRRPTPPEPPLPPIPEPLPPAPEPPPPPAPEPPLPPIPEPVPPEPQPPLPPSPEPPQPPPAPVPPPAPHPSPAPEPPLPPAPTPPVHPEPEPPQPREPEPPLRPEPEPPLRRPEPPLPPAPTPPVHPEPEPPLPPAPEPPVRSAAQPSAIWRPIEQPPAEPEPAHEPEPRPAPTGQRSAESRYLAAVAAEPNAPAYTAADVGAFTGEVTLDPMSLRRKVTLRSGAASLVVDDDGLALRKGLRRSAIAWSEIVGFESRTGGADSTEGWLVAVTRGGPVELPATRRPIGDLRYVLALLDAYRQRARILAAG